MTAAATDEAVDVELFLELEERQTMPCESPHHTGDWATHHGDGAFYATTRHACYGPLDQVFVVCERYAVYWNAPIRENVQTCTWCNARINRQLGVHILGPVNEGSRK